MLTLVAVDVWLASTFLLGRVVVHRRSFLDRAGPRASWPPGPGTAVGTRHRLSVAAASAIANAAVLVTWLPWLPTAISKVGTYASPDGGSPPGWILDQTLVVFALGHSVVGVASFPGTPEFAAQDALAHRLVAPFVVCLILGAFLAVRGRASFALPWLVVPVLGGALVSSGKRDVNIRYLIEATPAFVLLIAVALAWLLARRRARPVGIVALTAVLGASAVSLRAMYTDPAFARDDNRRAVAVIRERAAPGTGVVLDANFTPVFEYYAQGAWPAINEPREVPPNATATERELAAFAADRPQVWAILWHDYYADPRGIVWTWLKQHLYARDYLNVPGGLKVLAFDAKPPGAAPSGGVFGGVAAVEAYGARLAPSPTTGVATLDMYWRTLGRPSADYSIAAHLIDPAGNIYDSSDSQPANGDLPMTSWREGDRVHTTQPLRLEPWTPPGRYRVQVVVYDQKSSVALSATGPGSEAGGLMLPVAIEPGSPNATPPGADPLPDGVTRVDATFADIAVLRGYQLGRSPAGVALTLFWQALKPAPVNYKVFVHALDRGGNVAATGDSNAAAGASDMTTWQPGERARDAHRSAVPPSSVASIEVGLYDPTSGARVDVRTVRGEAPPDKALRLSVV